MGKGKKKFWKNENKKDGKGKKFFGGDRARGGGGGGNDAGPKRTLPHPRSLYKNTFGENIENLAMKFPELEPYVIEQNGRVQISYKDPESLCMLTRVLVMRDFDLDIELPHQKMIPFLQLRFNYLLWIEDLLDMWPSESQSEIVHGIDIGSHASCLYALVAAKKNGWKMLTSEYDNVMFDFAENNVKRNGLENLVTVKRVSARTFLDGVVDSSVPYYDFCMFSPPLYNKKDAMICAARSQGERQGLSGLTDREAECMAHGGEVNLMMNIVKECEKFKHKIKLFSIMVSRNSTIDRIGPILTDLVGDDYVATSVFCYGPRHTFGIAWTFDKKVKIKNDNRLKFHIRKEKAPINFVINNISPHDAYTRLAQILDNKKVMYKRITGNDDSKCCLEINSYHELWPKKFKDAAPSWKQKMINDQKWMHRAGSSNAGPCHSAQTPQTDKLPVLEAKVEITRVEGCNVEIQICPTGGLLGWNGGIQLLNYLQNEWGIQQEIE